MTFDAIQFKQQFPLFSQAENHSLVYLDNAATTQKPQCVIDAICNFYLHQNGNAQRASHRLARQATENIEHVREQSAQFLGANTRENIVFTRGATESINIIAYGLRHRLTPQDTIAVSYAEHHANLLPWQETAQAVGCKLTFVSPDLKEFIETQNENFKVIALTIASNALGIKTDLETLSAIKMRHPDAIVVLDITQWLAHEPINLSALPCDFAACSAHKFYGPTGIGILYGKTHQLDKLKPLMVGGEMVNTVNQETSTYQRGFRAFEAGTSSMAAIAGLGACLMFWQEQDRHAMAIHEQALIHHLHEQLHKLCKEKAALQLLTQAENNIGIATINCKAPYNTNDLAQWLDEQDIAVRTGEHCTQLLWQHYTPKISGGTLRLSIAAYNTFADIDKSIKAIKRYCEYIDNNETKSKYDLFETMDWQALLDKKSWQQRYKQLILWGKSLPEQANIRQEEFFIEGCESSVWLKHEEDEQQHYFFIDSDSDVIKGLASLILCRINGKSTEEINQIDFEQYFSDLGLTKHLSPSRNNGFYTLYNNVQKKIKTA